jgi:hypothetical protein
MNKQTEMSNVAEPKSKHFERQICQNIFSIKIAKDAAPSKKSDLITFRLVNKSNTS